MGVNIAVAGRVIVEILNSRDFEFFFMLPAPLNVQNLANSASAIGI
jgi:hypothetical protein